MIDRSKRNTHRFSNCKVENDKLKNPVKCRMYIASQYYGTQGFKVRFCNKFYKYSQAIIMMKLFEKLIQTHEII